jgi:Fe-S cluster assembly protein SufD
MSAEAVRHYAAAQAARRVPGPEWVDALRRRGMSAFTRVGFPTLKDESWKYTSLQPIEKRRFVPAQGVPLRGPVVDQLALEDLEAGPRLVFVNGRFDAAASRLDARAGVCVTSLSQALDEEPGRVQQVLGGVADANAHRFVALNTAFLADGAWIELADGALLDAPVYLLFVSAPESEQGLVQPRVGIVAGRDTRATVVEHYVSVEGATNLTNVVTELVAGPGAVVEHYCLIEEGETSFHLAGFHARLERGSVVRARCASAGARLARRDVHCVLAGEGAELALDGLFVAGARRHVDHTLRIEHAVPHTTSRTDYRGVAQAHGRGVFAGKVIVQRNAQRTDAHQSSRNLLLAPQAEIDTRPELEIYADDVKCSHGATVGQLDAEALYYLRTRGMGEAEARAALTLAFAEPVIARCTLPAARRRFAAALRSAVPEAAALQESL